MIPLKQVLERIRKLSLRTHVAIFFVSGIVSAVIGWVSCQLTDHVNIITILSLIAMIGSIVWYFVFVRCPHCRHLFNPRAAIPNFCPECGKKL